MSQISIRSLGPEDAHILDRVRPGLSREPLDPSQIWAFLATRINSLVVALDQGEVVGFASGTTLMHPDRPTEFLLSHIIVHPDLRRNGIGRRLLRRLVEMAEDRGCVRIRAQTQEENISFQSLAVSLGAQKTAATLFEW